jgi:hypothetical protein
VEETMEESAGRGPQHPTPPVPPRWKGIRSLDLVYQLNERCINLLYELAGDGAPDTSLPIITEHRELWTRMDPAARQALARMPFVITDAHFRDEMWWRRVMEVRANEAEPDAHLNGLPREASEHLMHETTMLAWQTARWDHTVAQMSLAMSSSVAMIISALTPQQIRVISARECHAIQVRWIDDVQFWLDLLTAAISGDEDKLGDLRLHAKLLLCGELTSLPK